MRRLQIISSDKEDTSVFNPVKMIDADGLNGEFAFEIASIIHQCPNNFKFFICMVQSNSDFIPSFSKVVAQLRKLMNEESIFWTHMHQNIWLTFKDT